MKAQVKVTVKLFLKIHICYARININMYKYGIEATEIRICRRINSGNLANAHMFTG